MKAKNSSSYRLLPWVILSAFVSTAPANDPELRQDLVARREAVMQKMGQQGMLVLFSAEPRHYSGDVNYEFRQENNLFYLSGIRQQGITLVLMPQNTSYREILFLPEQDPHAELWTGKMLSAEEAGEISGIENVWRASEFESFINAVLNSRPYRTNRYLDTEEYREFFSDLEAGNAEVFLLLQPNPGLRGELSKEFEWANRLRERFPGVEVKDATAIFHQLRMIKTAYEIKQLRQAIDITIDAHLEAMKRLRPEMWEYEIEAVIEYVFKKNNSFDWAFPSIVASGPNATILHYQESQRQTKAGELVLMDIGAEYNYYAADITRTVPVSGQFTPEQARIYELVLRAQKEALPLVKPGSSLAAVHRKAAEIIREGLYRLGLITERESDQYRAFFPHGVGHYLGLDVHDVSHGRTLKPGMVITVEPGIYVREDALERLDHQGVSEADREKIRQAVKQYLNIGIRIEDDFLITEDGHEFLSRRAPRDIAEIEAVMGAGR